eukprot:TRINITY_DN5717_c0_g3_i1.p1 TRINITY_DN5717_c0_g3~~TRINITY_DN5717_c0_g3_i1.p1  ORF type:complete len:164 (+),score=38.19 TRINITY_DN5717_c0_g3_i1:71-493(+)
MLKRSLTRLARSVPRYSVATAAPVRSTWGDIVEHSRLEAGDWGTGQDYMARTEYSWETEMAILKTAFAQYDLDCNGVLDREEIGAALHELGLDSSKAEIDMIFEAYDTNKDGVIDLSEWLGQSSPEFRTAVLLAFKDLCE